tara:strand:+ start:2845 stop:3390 length:546 start_codon:yes stop_codon:yes gene_type:complete
MDNFTYELKIPKSRIAIIIGKEGNIKKDLEEATKTELKIDSKEGDVFIKGDDALGLYIAREIIRAIARGFNPELAKLLLKQDYIFETIQLPDYAGKSKDTLIRLKGRVIGKEGKSRMIIEQLTETNISVFGKTVSIIGNSENVTSARRAIETLLRGATHSSVYTWLEKKRKQLKRKEIMEL